MTAILGPYHSYKDSGISWLGNVPNHWQIRRLGDTVKGCINGIWGNEPDGRNDLLCVRVADFDRFRHSVELNRPTLRAVSENERRRRILQRGDLLIEKSGGGEQQPVGVVVLYDHDRTAVCSNFIARMPVAGDHSAAYLTYLHAYLYAIRLNLRSIKQTTGIQNLDSSAYLDEPIALPPASEQHAMVRYLDHADRRIRRYIFAKQKLIKVLEEQKQAIIQRAVIRGLDPNVRLKPSGVEWLGDVPEHWEVSRSRRLFSVRTELARPDDVQLSATQAYGVIPQSEFESKVGRKVVRISMHLEKRRHVEKGDFVISMRSFQGGLERAWAAGAIRSSYVVLRPESGVDIGYFAYVFKSRGYIGALQATADFIRDGQDLTFDNFRRVDLPLIPLEEQRAIASFITESVQRLDVNRFKLAREIALLREYRTRLIADVVTGKLDVRAAAADLPEEVEEPEDLTFADAMEGADDAGLPSDESAEEEVIA